MAANSDFLNLVPWGLRCREAARYVGVFASKFNEMVRHGRMPHPFHIDTVIDLQRVVDHICVQAPMPLLTVVGETDKIEVAKDPTRKPSRRISRRRPLPVRRDSVR
jgi:hypothetical protein